MHANCLELSHRFHCVLVDQRKLICSVFGSNLLLDLFYNGILLVVGFLLRLNNSFLFHLNPAQLLRLLSEYVCHPSRVVELESEHRLFQILQLL